MDQTARFALPQLVPGQMQKEFYHNEALQLIDMLLFPIVESTALIAAPANPTTGHCYLVASGATGPWAGQDGALACFTDGGWRFVAPIEGMRLLERASGQIIERRNDAWETGIVRGQEVHINGQAVLRNRQPAIADPSGGAIVDSESRAAVTAALIAMRAHGLIS